MKLCINCGSKLSDEAKFCSRCGAMQSEAPVPEPGEAARAQAEPAADGAVQNEPEKEQGAAAADAGNGAQQPGPDTADARSMGGPQPQQNASSGQGSAQAQYGYSSPYGTGSGAQQYNNPYPGGQYQQSQYRQYQNQYQQYQQYQRPVSPYDHSAEFAAGDIAKNKIFAMLVYLGGLLGIIVALLATSKEKSDYVNFHVRQEIKIFIIEAILAIITVALSWTEVFLVAGLVCIAICIVIGIISFVQVCMGKAKEPVIIRRFGFLGR